MVYILHIYTPYMYVHIYEMDMYDPQNPEAYTTIILLSQQCIFVSQIHIKEAMCYINSNELL